MPPTALFIFRRDLRLEDNTALSAAIQDGYRVLGCFVFPPDQILPKKNPYFSNAAVQFMCESIESLSKQMDDKLLLIHEDHSDALNDIYDAQPFDAVYFNEDYSVYAKKRDAIIRTWCEKRSIKCVTREDYGLLPLHEGLVDEVTLKPYKVLSQFYKKVQREYDIRRPSSLGESKIKHALLRPVKQFLPSSEVSKFYQKNPAAALHGGRDAAMRRLATLGNLQDYKIARDFPAQHKTTLLSPYIKFGVLSIREVYWAIRELLGKDHALIRELVFRDFYMKIYALQPELQRGKALHDALDRNIPWSYDKKVFHAWSRGVTGFPIVDAGMRELNTTGHQHNRVRMICSSVLTKYFIIDWRWGLKYYYTHLLDADIFSNTAGWGFSSSTGPDAVPFFRAPFNPFIQSKKFDRDAEYIKHWIPELADVQPSDIHKWYDPIVRAKYDTNYIAPIVDYKEASKRAIKVFKDAFVKAKQETKA